jgi:dipeptidyl aminopeptidase/acylaminoacyl peptidase
MALAKDTKGVFKCGISVAPVSDWLLYGEDRPSFCHFNINKINKPFIERKKEIHEITNNFMVFI